MDASRYKGRSALLENPPSRRCQVGGSEAIRDVAQTVAMRAGCRMTMSVCNPHWDQTVERCIGGCTTVEEDRALNRASSTLSAILSPLHPSPTNLARSLHDPDAPSRPWIGQDAAPRAESTPRSPTRGVHQRLQEPSHELRAWHLKHSHQQTLDPSDDSRTHRLPLDVSDLATRLQPLSSDLCPISCRLAGHLFAMYLEHPSNALARLSGEAKQTKLLSLTWCGCLGSSQAGRPSWLGGSSDPLHSDEEESVNTIEHLSLRVESVDTLVESPPQEHRESGRGTLLDLRSLPFFRRMRPGREADG
ncbi:hypothetical protein VDGL01_06681 [Verticillium dahliae]